MIHEIDNPRPSWSDKDLDRMLVFCLLDRATTYKQVCAGFDVLDKNGLTDRLGITKAIIKHTRMYVQVWMTQLLREAGYRFPEPAAKNLFWFSRSMIDLRIASRQEIVERLPGIGMKLASMFLRNTRENPGVIAVLDTHVHKWMDEQGCTIPRSDYLKREKWFARWAWEHDRDPFELDREIWEARRR